MSESVVPTPSEQPKCGHGETKGHWVITSWTQYMCWGPVIATPKKCKIEKESGFCDPHESYECSVIAGEDYHDGPFLCPICGRHLPCRHCNDVTVSTEPETPVPEATVTLAISDKELAAIRYGYGALKMRKHPDALAAAYTIKKMLRRNPAPEAMCEVHLEKDGRLRVTAWVRPDQMYATLDAFSGALEPVPEDATCKWCGDTIQHIVDEDCWIHADGKSRWIQCNRDADPASDPSPEMREKVEALRARPNAPTSYDWGWNQALDAVLAALGEPK